MKELIEKYVGKKANIHLKGLKIQVEIKDVKVSYSHIRYLVSPIAGEGAIWVEEIYLIE